VPAGSATKTRPGRVYVQKHQPSPARRTAQKLAPPVQFREIDVLEKPSCYSYEIYSCFSPTLLPYTKFYWFIYIRELLGHKVT
jgi:hypothetical protein